MFASSTIPRDGGAIIDSIDPEVRDAVLAGSGDGAYSIDPTMLRSMLCNDLDADMTAIAMSETIRHDGVPQRPR